MFLASINALMNIGYIKQTLGALNILDIYKTNKAQLLSITLSQMLNKKTFIFFIWNNTWYTKPNVPQVFTLTLINWTMIILSTFVA